MNTRKLLSKTFQGTSGITAGTFQSTPMQNSIKALEDIEIVGFSASTYNQDLVSSYPISGLQTKVYFNSPPRDDDSVINGFTNLPFTPSLLPTIVLKDGSPSFYMPVNVHLSKGSSVVCVALTENIGGLIAADCLCFVNITIYYYNKDNE